MLTASQILRIVEPIVYGRRLLTLAAIGLFTLAMLWQCRLFAWDTGIAKQLPVEHDYVQTLLKHQAKFGSGNLIVVALRTQADSVYSEEFLNHLKSVHDDLSFITGVDKPTVYSLFAPSVRYTEVTEDGFFGKNVVPQKSRVYAEDIDQIKANAAKAGTGITLISADGRGAMIRAELLEHNPDTGEKLDYLQLAKDLEALRKQYEVNGITVHMLGFPLVVGAIVDAVAEVLGFFVLTALLTGLLLWVYCASWKLAMLPLGCTLVAIIWEFGLLLSLGYKLDPFAILVPFLVLAIGVSHGVQMINGWVDQISSGGNDPLQASLATFRKLAIPGTAALITDVFGFAAIALIDIDVIQEMAINAALGVAAVIFTNKVLMPILLSYTHIKDIERFKARLEWREQKGEKVWRFLSKAAASVPAYGSIVIASLLFGFALWQGQFLQIGDTQAGVPELRPDSRYNRDAAVISTAFPQNLDVLQVFMETEPDACVDYSVMQDIDRFVWHMQNSDGVERVYALTEVAKQVYAFMEKGNPKFQSLSRNQDLMSLLIRPAPAKVIRNADCSVMPVLVFLRDHRAETINTVIAAAEQFRASNNNPKLNIALASGNVGIMAATNEIVERQEKPILLYVYAAIILMCWLSFRNLAGIVSIVVPLALVSLLAYALMAMLDIGLKVATLPVVALAVGIGIDYGIYIYSVLEEHYKRGLEMQEAYLQTLRQTGKAVIFTGLALGTCVLTWLFSDLQFQRDMGVLLMFMFVANMFGAILLLPAIAKVLLRRR